MNRTYPLPAFLLLILFLSTINYGATAQSGFQTLSTDCSSWLNIKAAGGGVRIGDLDIPGNKVTVEALVTRTALPWDTTSHGQGDIVSKQRDPNDVNYLLRADRAEITTTNGYHRTPAVCEFKSDKTYHLAMVYDGTTLKFYRNGFLLAQTPCSGDMINNDWITTIGEYAYSPGFYGTALIGYINEVRIWNVARTQSEIRAFMNNPLPSPTTQIGLKAYYQFNDLQNKQGNPVWNGTIVGNVSVNTPNPICATFVQDSCGMVCNIPADFGFRQQLCNPSKIDFSSNNENIQNISWDFGVYGTSNLQNPTLNLTSANQTIPVKLNINFKDGCSAQTEKEIKLEMAGESAPINRLDTIVCIGSEITIKSPESYSYCWDVGNGIIQNNVQQQTFIASTSENYVYKRLETQTNLITNGNLESGNTGFSSELTYATSGSITGTYSIGTDPKTWNNIISCALPSPGSKIMMVNGDNSTGKIIWKTKVVTTPSNNYLLAFRLIKLKTGSPNIGIYVNGAKIDNAIFNSGNSCNWEDYKVSWNSGGSSEAEISLVIEAGTTNSSLFALDDFYFGLYSISVENINVRVESLPNVNATEDFDLCIGTSKILGVVTDAPLTVKWSPEYNINNSSSLTPEVNPVITTKYFVSASSLAGCKSEDSVLVTVRPKPVFSINPVTSNVCEGNELKIMASGGSSYQWLNAGTNDPTGQEVRIIPDESGSYSVIISDEFCNMIDTLSSSVIVNPLPHMSVSKSNDIDCKTSIARIEVSGVDRVDWMADPTIIETGMDFIRVAPFKNTVYFMAGYDQNGCMVEDSVLISVSNTGSDELTKIPNAFSPNMDGKNDCFGGLNLGALSDFQLTIWNRWGQKVFQTGTQSNCWDGRFNGKDQPEGTYIYQLHGKSICGVIDKKGTLQLIR